MELSFGKAIDDIEITSIKPYSLIGNSPTVFVHTNCLKNLI